MAIPRLEDVEGTATGDLLTGIGQASSTEGGLAGFNDRNPDLISDAAEAHQDVIEQSVGIRPDTGAYAPTSSGSSDNQTGNQGMTGVDNRVTEVFSLEGNDGMMGKLVLVGVAALAAVSALGR